MKFFSKSSDKTEKENVWARPNMKVSFRVEVMPGRTKEERTFQVQKVLPNGRVILEGFAGEHRQGAFEKPAV